MKKKDEIFRFINIVDIVDSPYQGRLYGTKDKISGPELKQILSLQKNIEKNGLLQPIIVRELKNEKFEIIDGHRRLIVHRRLGRGFIKAIVKNYSDEKAQIASLIANMERKDLSPIENAYAFKKILASGVFKDKKELSVAIGKDETYVGDIINLTKMDNRIIDDMIKNNTIKDVRHLRIIRNFAKLNKDGYSDEQYALYNKIKLNNLSRSQTQKYIQSIKNKTPNREYKPKVEIDYSELNWNININIENANNNKYIYDIISKEIDLFINHISNINVHKSVMTDNDK